MKSSSVAVGSRFISPTNHPWNLKHYFLPTSGGKANLERFPETNNNIWTPTLPSTSYSTVKRNGVSVSATAAQPSRNHPGKFHAKEDKGWIHFVGVNGCGMSALALLALKQGYEVSGSDIVWNSYMGALQEAGAHLYVGHSELNFGNSGSLSTLLDAVVVSSAFPPDNVEIVHAKSAGIPALKRGDWLGKLTEAYNLIAVSGSHGKSTTTIMIAYILKAMGDDLTVVVGAQFAGENVIRGTGLNFVLEADEYDGCFLGLAPHVTIVTYVDWEHVDIFPDEESARTIFRRLLSKIRSVGHLILCEDRYISFA